jgi:Heavy metal binding domain
MPKPTIILGEHVVTVSRRTVLLSFAGCANLYARQRPDAKDAAGNKDWVCPMDPEVRSDKPGICPRCGMKLVLKIPERVEYPMELLCTPEPARPEQPIELTLRVLHPDTNKIVSNFEIVHEKLMHLFVVSENLEYFAHEHPVLQSDGSFKLTLQLPYGGMYRLLADFYPAGAVPQLAVNTLFVAGRAPTAKLEPSLTPSRAANLTATLHSDPEELLAGLENRLVFSLNPAEDLQPYLGAWGHMLAASADLIDLLHVHPFLVRGGDIQFNIIFPRPGLYRIWTQFQRSGAVNTTVFTVPVKAL